MVEPASERERRRLAENIDDVVAQRALAYRIAAFRAALAGQQASQTQQEFNYIHFEKELCRSLQ